MFDYDCGYNHYDYELDEDYPVQCNECKCIYSSDESECPECGSEEIYEEPEKLACSHCGKIVSGEGEAYCDRCGNRITYDYDNLDTNVMQFADPCGVSALRAASTRNPRIFPCPTCGEPDVLTATDKRMGYQCDICADRLERGGW